MAGIGKGGMVGASMMYNHGVGCAQPLLSCVPLMPKILYATPCPLSHTLKYTQDPLGK